MSSNNLRQLLESSASLCDLIKDKLKQYIDNIKSEINIKCNIINKLLINIENKQILIEEYKYECDNLKYEFDNSLQVQQYLTRLLSKIAINNIKLPKQSLALEKLLYYFIKYNTENRNNRKLINNRQYGLITHNNSRSNSFHNNPITDPHNTILNSSSPIINIINNNNNHHNYNHNHNQQQVQQVLSTIGKVLSFTDSNTNPTNNNIKSNNNNRNSIYSINTTSNINIMSNSTGTGTSTSSNNSRHTPNTNISLSILDENSNNPLLINDLHSELIQLSLDDLTSLYNIYDSEFHIQLW